MKTFTSAAAFAALVTSAFATPTPTENTDVIVARQSAPLPTVTVKGNAFWAGDKRFYMRGIDWQPGGSSLLKDPLADEDVCKRDIAEFKKLNVNTVRIYTVDNTKDHTNCMKLLNDAGIYLVLDVNSPKYSINRADPHPSYNAFYLQNVFATMDKFVGYTNTLAFFSANEVINDDKTTNCAPYVKAVTRDMRNYLKAQGHRQIPVGYSAADVDSNRKEMAEYMNCGSDDERSDFFAFNDYSWCDPSSFTTSGWDQKVKNFTGYGLPIFLSEFGCNINRPRQWNEVKSLFSTDMSSVYSGGLVYEYSEEGSDYGVGTIKGNTFTKNVEFDPLAKAFKDTPNPSGDGGYNATTGPASCPPTSSTWEVTSNDLPSIPSKAAEYMKSGAGAGVGLAGSGSQTAGERSTSSIVSGSGEGAVSGTGSAASASGTKSSAATAGLVQGPLSMAPFVVSGLAVAFSLVGAALL